MHFLFSVYRHVKPYERRLYILALMLFFWAVFDGLVSYSVPILITKNGYSGTVMGLIISSSSFFGALFDVWLAFFFKNTNFRRVYLLMLIICFLVPLCFYFNSLAFYLVAMFLWGLYFDFQRIGNYDFVGRFLPSKEHSHSFGIFDIFKSLGVFISPIIAIYVLDSFSNLYLLAIMWILLFTAFIFYFLLIRQIKDSAVSSEQLKIGIKKKQYRKTFGWQVRQWLGVGKIMTPVLIFTFFINVSYAFIWTIGPLFAIELKNTNPLGGFFVSAYLFFSLVAGWFVGKLNQKFGKKRTAFLSLLFGSLVLCLIIVNQLWWFALVIGVLSGFFFSFTYPSIAGAYADYISESPEYEKDIETFEDFFSNLGYVVGPVLAGVLMDAYGARFSFFLIGLFGLILSLILLKVTPKQINIKYKK